MDRKPEKRVRRCLKCGERFQSRGFGNRICEKCNKENNTIYHKDPHFPAKERSE